MPVLEFGSSGDEVRRVQEALVNLGYFVGAIDGQYGLKTAAAVAYLQSTHGLDIDGVAGPQVFGLLDVSDSFDVGVTAQWPNIEVWHAGDEFVVQLDPVDGLTQAMDVRVVVWFRGPGGEEHTEEQVTVTPGSHALAHLNLPSTTAQSQGEVYFTGYVFDMQGSPLSDEGAGSFRVDLPDRI
jgi:peptidoglycan hydrolase-like protein with peptidoglycan-binding domain